MVVMTDDEQYLQELLPKLFGLQVKANTLEAKNNGLKLVLGAELEVNGHVHRA